MFSGKVKDGSEESMHNKTNHLHPTLTETSGLRTRLEVNQAAQKLRGGDQRGKVGLVYKEVLEYYEDHNFDFHSTR